VLQDLPKLDGNPFVICGGRNGRHLVNLEKPWRAIRAKAGLDDVRLHDLRHSYASVAAGSGLSLPIIGKLLGHTQPQTTARYAISRQIPYTRLTAELARRSREG
jgi:integrase